MLTQSDIDKIVLNINDGIDQYIYYVAHYVETREGVIDESQYKSNPKFRVIKVQVESIQNAYQELLRYQEHPDLYETETEIAMYDAYTEYVHTYTIPTPAKSYTKEINPRMPSIIYGISRRAVTNDGTIHINNDKSPVKAVYVNHLEYGDLSDSHVQDRYENKELDWKYITLTTPAIVDGIEYKYITSDWYILKTIDFPKLEYPLIETDAKCAYFMSPQEAFSFIKECEA